jgi:hypothetical protein
MTTSETRALLSALTDDELRNHIADKHRGPYHRHLARETLRLRTTGRAERFTSGELVTICAAAGAFALAFLATTLP